MLTLHVDADLVSPWVFHAFVALEEKRLPFALQPEVLPILDGRRDELRERGLFAKVPILEHGQLWLGESLAISEYLAETFPYPTHPRLVPADLAERARARQLMSFLRTDLFALREERSSRTLFAQPATTPLSERGQADVAELLRVAARVVPPGRGSMFATWCIADADLALALMRLIANGHHVPADLDGYARAVWSRPSIQLFVEQGRRARAQGQRQ